MNLITADKFERRFKRLIGELNQKKNDDKEYHRITEKICFLVGEMNGTIDSLELEKFTKGEKDEL